MTAIIQQLDRVFKQELANRQQFAADTSFDSTLIVHLSRLQSDDQDLFNIDTFFNAQREALKKQTHLNYSLGFVQNFKPTQADGEDNILYQRRMLNAVEWNILKDGFFETRSKLRSLALEEAFLNAAQQFSYKRVDFPTKMNHAIYIFNTRKNELLAQREKMLIEQRKWMEQLYFSKEVSREKMLELHTKLAEVEALKQIYGTYNEYKVTDIDSADLLRELPLFDVNYMRIENNQQGIEDLDTLKQKMLEDLKRQNNWFRQISVSTYLRHSFYDLLTTNPAYRSFFGAGFGLTVPLTFNRKDNLEAEKQKMLKRFDDLKTAELNRDIDILNETYEYRYHLKQYVLFYQKKQLVLENIRQERVKEAFHDEDYNPLNALNLIDQLYQIEIELLDIKQNLYIRLLKIQEKTKTVPMEKLIVPFELPNFEDVKTQLHRTVYVWSSAFSEHKVSFLTEYVVYNHFDEVQLAVSLEDTLLSAKIEFINNLFEKGIEVNVMFGQNLLLSLPVKKDFMMQCLQGLPLSKISGIQLDVEPQALEGWQTERTKLQDSYLSLLSDAKTICDDYHLHLTVDLSLHLDSNYIAAIAQKVDGIRLMCYENIKPDYLKRKIAAFEFTQKPISVSLRMEDFATRQAMEDFAEEITRITHTESVNFHDIGRLINMDQSTLKEHEEH